jgi:hypothetical protein
MAVFNTEAGFKIKSRRIYVIAGDNVEGTLSHGKRIIAGDVAPLYGKVIERWEYIDFIRTDTFKIGLVLVPATEAELEALLQLDLHDKRIEIEE